MSNSTHRSTLSFKDTLSPMLVIFLAQKMISLLCLRVVCGKILQILLKVHLNNGNVSIIIFKKLAHIFDYLTYL